MGRFAALLTATVVVLVPFGVSSSADPAFKPADGRYAGEYTSGNFGPGKVRLQVGGLHRKVHGVRLLKWSGKLQCPSGTTEPVGVEMSAARIGRTFSGFMNAADGLSARFTGRFTANDALKARVRVTLGSGAERCDTGPIRFVAQRVGP